MCSSLVHLYPANRIFGHLFLESSTNPFPKSTLFSGLKIGVHYNTPAIIRLLHDINAITGTSSEDHVIGDYTFGIYVIADISAFTSTPHIQQDGKEQWNKTKHFFHNQISSLIINIPKQTSLNKE